MDPYENEPINYPSIIAMLAIIAIGIYWVAELIRTNSDYRENRQCLQTTTIAIIANVNYRTVRVIDIDGNEHLFDQPRDLKPGMIHCVSWEDQDDYLLKKKTREG